MFDYHSPDFRQFVASESLGTGEFHWIQPVFGHLVAMFHMHMGRLASFAAKKEKAEALRYQ